MSFDQVTLVQKKYIMRTNRAVCQSTREVLSSKLFKEIVTNFAAHLRLHNSQELNIFNGKQVDRECTNVLIKTLQLLGEAPADHVVNTYPEAKAFLKDPDILNTFVEDLYNYWRSFDRFIVYCSGLNAGAGSAGSENKPHRVFNQMVEKLQQSVREVYRNIKENITGSHPRIYRQVTAGSHIGVIAAPKEWPCPKGPYAALLKIPMIRQILLSPPIIFDPPMNKRTGQFQKIHTNPLEGWSADTNEWFCFPARVGPLLIHIFFHQTFMELGCSLANLFDLAEDEELNKKPDAIYTYGVPGDILYRHGSFPTVFFEDSKNDILVGAVPNKLEFGYFGYLKKMTLTLHNIVMMKQGRMPFHGAMVRILMKNGIDANILLIGDTGAGKSELLEAFRVLAGKYIRKMVIIADDMGSLEIDASGKIIGYGTETGAFVRLDDLQPGFAFGEIDRTIIMSPHKINARAVLPITTMDNVLHGYQIDYLLYANNYEEIDKKLPIIERLNSCEEALCVFREGKVMAKGTTTSTGIGHTYFSNIFGPLQYKELHDRLANEYFKAAYNAGIYVGQIRTRLGVSGWETKGPEEAAKALFGLISSRKKQNNQSK